MNLTELCTELRSVIGKMLLLSEEYLATLKKIKKYVEKKDWQSFEKVMEESKGFGEQFHCLESKRLKIEERLENILGVEHGLKATSLLPLLPEEERKSLAPLVEKLRRNFKSVKTQNNAMVIYAKKRASLISDTINTFTPGGEGRVYMKSGSVRENDRNSIILDHQV